MTLGSARPKYLGTAGEPQTALRAQHRYGDLFAPLDRLLCAGGDERLALVRSNGLNMYGCKPAPRPQAISFSSSTASSISLRAYEVARAAQRDLAKDGAARGILECFEARIEQLRIGLRTCLGLDDSGAEIVFSASGTDAQLQALALASVSLGTELTSVIVGSDQTGSGTEFTAAGRHFASSTARGMQVAKGSRICAGGAEIQVVPIAFAITDGSFRSAGEMDELVFEVVARQIASGRNVLLQAMQSSKFGWKAPSDDCLAAIAGRWPANVQIVVDACQMRIGRARIADYLTRGYLILFTGSKFFCGPPFSGGLLVPEKLAASLAAAHAPPGGLYDYADRADIPLRWAGIRQGLSEEPNFGKWLRWEAALAEMCDFYALPAEIRAAVLLRLADEIPTALGAFHRVTPLSTPHTGQEPECDAPTIFPFLVHGDGNPLEVAALREIHRDLNRNVAGELFAGATAHECLLAARPCHIGQPVLVKQPNGRSSAALRIAIGARNLVDASPERGAEHAVTSILHEVAVVLSKLDLILKNRERTRVAEREPRPQETAHGI